jgi:hypothetical protein
MPVDAVAPIARPAARAAIGGISRLVIKRS